MTGGGHRFRALAQNAANRHKPTAMARLHSFAGFCFAHPRWLALVLGAVAACGFQPLALWPLTLLAVAGLLELIVRAPGWRQTALIGWLFGIAHFSLGNNWIATAFTYQADMPKWLGAFAVVLLSLYLAVYPMLAALGAWLLTRRPSAAAARLPLILALAGCWIVAEWLRAWIFSGFAWNPLGIVALGGFSRPGLALAAPWLGTYALSGIVVLLAGCIWVGMGGGSPLPKPPAAPLTPARRLALVVTPFVLFLLPLSGGNEAGTLPFTLIQPDVRQENLDNPRLWEGQFVSLSRLTQARSPGQRRLVLWPESGIPDYLREGYPDYLYDGITYRSDPKLARQRIGQVVGPGAMLLTGAVDLEMKDGAPVGARNVITAIDSAGTIRGSYAKAHLVPYGEYLPLRWLLEPLGASRLVAGTLEFWPGPGPRTIGLGPWGKAGMQLCYEIVFSGEVVDSGHRPDYIFNPSNDGWFGSWGPPQHLAQARLRAIEEGLPVLRATTTGISAVIDADGVVRQHVARHVAGRLDGIIPPAHAPTLFARSGNLLPLAWAALFLLLSLVALRRGRR
jgi:apolipoprotein N-acyltransferase